VCIPPEIFNGITKAVKGLLNVRAPVDAVQKIKKAVPVTGICQALDRPGEYELIAVIELFQAE
jgi:hypothetical protein